MKKRIIAVASHLVGMTVEYRSAKRGGVEKVNEVEKFRDLIQSEIDRIHDTVDRQEQLLYLVQYIKVKRSEPYFDSVVKPYAERKIAEIGGTTLYGSYSRLPEDEYEKSIRSMWTSTAPYMRSNLQKEIVKMYLHKNPDRLKGSITEKEKTELYEYTYSS